MHITKTQLHCQLAGLSLLHAPPQTPGNLVKHRSSSPGTWPRPADWNRRWSSKHSKPHAYSVLQMVPGCHWRRCDPTPMLCCQYSMALLFQAAGKLYTLRKNPARSHWQLMKNPARWGARNSRKKSLPHCFTVSCLPSEKVWRFEATASKVKPDPLATAELT